MNILLIAPIIPYPLDNGGRIRVYKFLENLSRRHQVDLITFERWENNPTISGKLREVCSSVHIVPLAEQQYPANKRKYQLLSLFHSRPYQFKANYSQKMQATIDRCLRERTYDIIQVEFSQMAYYRFPSHANCVLDQHNVEYEILYRTYRAATDWGRRLYSFVEWKKFKRDEINNCRKFPVCLTTSERDKQVLAADLPLTDFKVIPNGVDCTYFSSNGHETEPQQPALIFTGTINYHPNTDGLKYFLEDVFPLIRQQVPDVKFYIVGRQPPPEIQRYDQSPNIIVTGGVDDTRPYFEKATVVVVPLRIGGGTRLKLLEAMAMGKPVVSTSIGAEGTAVTPGQNIMLADEPGSFAQATVALLKKAALRKHLAVEGRKLVEEKYDWRAITQKLEQTYESLLNRVREPSEISRGGL